jgi:hypothetical protein
MGGRLTALLSSALPVNVYGNQLVHDLHHNNPMQPILGSLLYNKTYLSLLGYFGCSRLHAHPYLSQSHIYKIEIVLKTN